MSAAGSAINLRSSEGSKSKSDSASVLSTGWRSAADRVADIPAWSKPQSRATSRFEQRLEHLCGRTLSSRSEVQLTAEMLGRRRHLQVGQALAQTLVAARFGRDTHRGTRSGRALGPSGCAAHNATLYSLRLRTSTASPVSRAVRSMIGGGAAVRARPDLTAVKTRSGIGRSSGRSAAHSSPTTCRVVRCQRRSTTSLIQRAASGSDSRSVGCSGRTCALSQGRKPSLSSRTIRSTLPLVLARYGLQARGITPSRGARSTHPGARMARPSLVLPMQNAGSLVGEDLAGHAAQFVAALQ
jgi:hypothetical protein